MGLRVVDGHTGQGDTFFDHDQYVDELTPDTFSEQSVTVVGPFADSKYPDGIHTISAMGDWTIVDARRSIFDSRAFIGAVKRGLLKFSWKLARGKRGAGRRSHSDDVPQRRSVGNG